MIQSRIVRLSAAAMLLTVFATAVQPSAAAGRPAAAPAGWALATLAECTGPDGSSFTTEIVSVPGRAVRFIQVHEEGRTELLLVSGTGSASAATVSSRGAGQDSWRAADPAMVSFVRGHDVHRLYLDAWESSPHVTGPERLVRQVPPAFGGGDVVISYGDHRPVIGIELPFAVDFLHDGQTFRYRFRTVLPFRLAPGTALPTDPDSLFARLADLGEIAAVHERAMQAHRDGDVAALVADQVPVGIISGRGRLQENTKETTRQKLGPYLASTTFERYADVVAPVIAVSVDGTLAWLACEMEAVGVQRAAPDVAEQLNFGYSWVELLVKQNGRWLRNGNASSGRP